MEEEPKPRDVEREAMMFLAERVDHVEAMLRENAKDLEELNEVLKVMISMLKNDV